MNGFMDLLEQAVMLSHRCMPWVMASLVPAALLAGVVLAINLGARRWLSAAQMGLLWGLVLVRLLLPVAPASSLSLQNLSGTFASLVPQIGVVKTVDHDEAQIKQVRYADGSREMSVGPIPIDPSTFSTTDETPLLLTLLIMLLVLSPLVWLLASIGSLTWTLACHAWLCLRVRRTAPCNDSRLLTLWGDICRHTGQRRPIPLLLLGDISQPAVMGALWPKLLLPLTAADFDDAQLRMIMLHELAHVRRRDLAANWLLVVIRGLHWWNPVYWLAAARYRNLREQACDAFVVRHLAHGGTRDYSELLLTLSARSPRQRRWRVMLPASILGLLPSWFRTRSLSGRLRALRTAAAERSHGHTAVVTAATLLLAVCGMTDARPPAPAPTNLDWLPPAAIDEMPALPAAAQFTRAVDPASAFGKWAAENNIGPDSPQFTVECRFCSSLHEVGRERLGIALPWRYNDAVRTVEPQALGSTQTAASPQNAQSPEVRVTHVVNDGRPMAVAVLTAQQAAAFVHACQSDRRSNLLSAPKVTVFGGQQATVTDIKQTPFVTGVYPIVGESATAYSPVITVRDEGTKIHLRVDRDENSDQISVVGRCENCILGNVREAVTQNPGITIQVPTASSFNIDFSSKLLDDQTLLVGYVPSLESPGFFYLLLRVHQLTSAELER